MYVIKFVIDYNIYYKSFESYTLVSNVCSKSRNIEIVQELYFSENQTLMSMRVDWIGWARNLVVGLSSGMAMLMVWYWRVHRTVRPFHFGEWFDHHHQCPLLHLEFRLQVHHWRRQRLHHQHILWFYHLHRLTKVLRV